MHAVKSWVGGISVAYVSAYVAGKLQQEMIPPKHLEYYIIEWVTASLEAIVSHRLFASIGAPSSRRVNVIRPAQVSDEQSLPSRTSISHSSKCLWDAATQEDVESIDDTATEWPNGAARSACQFSEGFTPESARHFQVEIPQIESLRAALLSDPKFDLRSPWQLRVVVVLHITPSRGSTQSSHGAPTFTLPPLSTHEARPAGIGLNEERLNSRRESLGGQPWCCDTLGDLSLSGASGINGTHRCVSPLAALRRAGDNQKSCFLEQWIVSFNPSTAVDRQARFEHRKLCTALKGLMAAIHFLPTHSALLALTNTEKASRRQGEQRQIRAQQNSFVETHICARWQGHETKARRGRVATPWTPVVSYRSDLEGSLTCRSLEALDGVSGDLRRPAEGLCGTTVRSSPTSHATGQNQKVATSGAIRAEATSCRANIPTQRPWVSRAGGGAVGASEADSHPPGSPGPRSLDRTVLCRSRPKQHATSTPGGSGAPSLPGLSCRSSAEGYAASSVTKLDSSETRTLLSLTTSLGIVDCTVTYNEEMAQSIITARELDAIDGCLEDFHPIADGYTERGISDGPEDGCTVVSDTDPWLDMEDPYSSFDGVLPHRQRRLGLDLELDLELSLGTPTENVFSPRDRGCPPKENWGIWHTLLHHASIGRAYQIASIPVNSLRLGPLLEWYPPRAILKPHVTAAAVADTKVDKGEGEQGIPCTLPSVYAVDAASRWSPRYNTVGSGSVPFSSEGETAPAFFQLCRTVCGRGLTQTCDELMPERSDEYGENLKAEERVLLDENEFGGLWLNSASSFSLANGSLPRNAHTDSPDVPHLQSSTTAEYPSVIQRISEALASEEAFPALDAMKYLSDSLHALERIVGELLPSAGAPLGASDYLSFLLTQQQEPKDGVNADRAKRTCPTEPDKFGVPERWQYISICAAAVGAQQAETRALRELCLAELDPPLVRSNWVIGLEDLQIHGEAQLDTPKQNTVPTRHRKAVAAYLLQPESSMVPMSNSHPAPLEQYLSRLCSEKVDWLDHEDDGDSFESILQKKHTESVTPQEDGRDPWCIEEMLSALRSFEVRKTTIQKTHRPPELCR